MKTIFYLISHPIQYQSPLIRLYSKVLKGKLSIFYISDFSLNIFYEKDFNSTIKWDIDLLKGQKYFFLNKNQNKHYSFLSPFINFNFLLKLIKEKPDYLLIHGWSNINFFTSMILAKILKIKILIRCESYIKKRGMLKDLISAFYYRLILFFPNYYLYIGTKNKEFYLKYGNHKNLIAQHYSVDNKFLKFQSTKSINQNTIKKFELKNNCMKFFFVGKLIDRKNPLLILKAINNIKENINNCAFYFIGDGPQLDLLQKYIKKNNLKKIFFLGFQNTTILPRIIKYFDVFIFPSIQENWGLVLNEALVLEKTAIVSDSVVSHYDLINQRNGLIFKNNDFKELSKSIVYCLNNKKKLEIMKKNSRQILSTFSFKNNLISILKYFKNET